MNYTIENVKKQSNHLQQLIDKAGSVQSPSDGSYRHGLRTILADDQRANAFVGQLLELFELIDCLSENDK